MSTKLIESTIDTSKIWYLGNNLKPNLKIVLPAWYHPFFLTTDKDYAADYADYGVWKVTLDSEVRSRILDFSNPADVRKLKWPSEIVELINAGTADLNSIARELFLIKNGKTEELYYLDAKNVNYSKCIRYFDKIQVPQHPHSNWDDEYDYEILLKMWFDIFNKKFSGFTHVEFNHLILALFNLLFLDKISVNKIN